MKPPRRAIDALLEGTHADPFSLLGTHAGPEGTFARALLRATLDDAPGIRTDYAEVVDPASLEPLQGPVDGSARAVVAASAGTTRLIDNLPL